MPEQMMYRKRLLLAVEAFLQDTPSSIAQGQKLIEQCYLVLRADSQRFTLNGLIWRSLVHPLTDSVCFTSREYLLEIRKILQGSPSPEREKIFIKQDFRPYLTPDETEWYAQLLSLLDFVQSLPFAQVAAATAEARQRNISGYRILETIPEAMSIMDAYEDYQQRKTAIDAIATSIPIPEQFGEETIYRLVLLEVSNLITTVDIRLSAVYKGYPTPEPPYSLEGENADAADMSESLAWAGRALDALSGVGNLFFSWRLLANVASFDADLLLISLH